MSPARGLFERLGFTRSFESGALLHEDDTLKVTHIPRPNARSLVLCFTGIGHGLGGIDTQRPEFTGSTAAVSAATLFIFDKTRSWGNRLDFARVAALARPLARGPVIGLGNSMGGFNAILMSNFIEMRTCVAFAPQFSLHPGIVPSESRWQSYAARIENWRFPSLAGQFNDRTRYLTVNGDTPEERRHWSRFPDLPNAEHLVIRGHDHDGAAMLKRAGVLGPFLSAAFNEGDARATLAGLDWFRFQQEHSSAVI